MKLYKDIIQGTENWFEIRHGKVGGSRLEKIMTNLDKPVKSCSEYLSILAENMEDYDPFEYKYQSAEMAHGNEFEPKAREEYERINGVKVEQIGWAQHDDLKLVGISPDGLIPSINKAIEIKCPSCNTHLGYVVEPKKLIEKYCWQIVHYFLVLGVDSVDCISYRPENKLKPIVIETVTPETVISISKKGEFSVCNLVIMAGNRLIELEKCIEEDIEKLSNVNVF